MGRIIDQIRASRLPSNLMQFAARGALQVPPAETIEILVYLARYNKAFGELARMTLAGWDEKASLGVVSDPTTPAEVLNYFISPDNLRPRLLSKLLENPSVREEQVVKLAGSALRDTLVIMLRSPRVKSLRSVVEALQSNPYLEEEEAQELAKAPALAPVPTEADSDQAAPVPEGADESETTVGVDDESVFSYLREHAGEIATEDGKPFQPIGGFVDMPGHESSPLAAAPPDEEKHSIEADRQEKRPPVHAPGQPAKRQNTVQKINGLDVKGRIQLALKGNKEERSILIRDGSKVVALAVLEAPKLSDIEVEKFASQKNVLEAVLRQIPLKRRFMKNYIVVRNLVANPRTPLDLSLGLMKNLLTQDLKNLSSNKEVSETIRKLAYKMYKQKQESANKK